NGIEIKPGVSHCCFCMCLRRNYAVFYSDVLELAYEEGHEALSFIIAHELAHIQRKHIQKKQWLTPGLISIPFLQHAYSRACEYTCDAMAAHLVPKGAEAGLKLLAVGKSLQKRVSSAAWIKQAEQDAEFWCWIVEVFSTHPHLFKRLQAIQKYSQHS
ncbi:MAG: M48 family metalloprotease, partial [Vampirovibrionales bacterium]